MSKKRIRTLVVLVLLLGLLGSCAYILYNLPFYLIPLKIPFIPKDTYLISETLNQELPGYSHIEVLAASGNHQIDDPRLITVKVMFETGETPVSCVGQIFHLIGDPGFRGIRWETIECEGLARLIGATQSVLTTSYEPNTVWYPPFYACFNDQVASVLYYWTKKDNTIFDHIGWPKIKTTVEEMLTGKREVKAQIVLFDPNNIDTVDYDPQMPADQKVKQYYLECNGTVKEYVGESNIEIYNKRGVMEDFMLINPLTDKNTP